LEVRDADGDSDELDDILWTELNYTC